ncbi:alpha/beta hydrolase-fold protein, partial [Escherichia coli]|uniref:alpha/beta hydrolase-fold protein n=1 Tax=Escherichia coli TaxID=562 RepID=UPI0039DF70CD
QYGKGEGAAYIDFIAKTLKPFIDAKYRTRKGPDYTYIAGSSMGGLISWYAMIKYPDIFGGAGIFSPSFWVSPQVAV